MKNDVSAIPAGKSNYLKRLLFLLVCVLMSGNAVWAQQPTITIHAKNQSLKEVLKEIEQQSKHSFIYSSSTINVNQKVNLECNGVSLDKALEQLGAIADITYSISNHQIMLAPAGKQPTPAAVAGNQKGAKAGQTIRGVVKDENGDPIVGASVFFKGTTVGVATDVDGKFTLKTTEAGQLLVASFIGYSNAEVKVMPNQEVYNFVRHHLSQRYGREITNQRYGSSGREGGRIDFEPREYSDSRSLYLEWRQDTVICSRWYSV